MNKHLSYLLSQPDLETEACHIIYQRYADHFGSKALNRKDLEAYLYKNNILAKRTMIQDSPGSKYGYMVRHYKIHREP